MIWLVGAFSVFVLAMIAAMALWVLAFMLKGVGLIITVFGSYSHRASDRRLSEEHARQREAERWRKVQLGLTRDVNKN